ncbi:MAG: GerMN domain-containing protein [Eubacteriales bacterium]
MARIKKLKFIVIITILFLGACNNSNDEGQEVNTLNKNENRIEIDLFFSNKDYKKLVIEKRYFDEVNQEQLINNILNQLKEGPEKEDLRKIIPDSLDIKSIKLSDNQTLRITFDERYDELNSTDEVFNRASIVKTLTQLDSVKYVEFYINDKPLKTDSGKPIGLMKNSDFVDDSDIQSELKDISLTLYFADDDTEGLKMVQEKIQSDPNVKLEKKIIEMLIEGPKSESLNPTIPEGTKLNDIYVKDGICYVDFSEEFKENHWGGSGSEYITIYSIVNSIVELPNINKVQFLIDGEKHAEYKGHIKFDGLFERNLDIVIQ